MHRIDKRAVVSFVHGYHDPELGLPDERPALWEITQTGSRTHRYPFPRRPSDFDALGNQGIAIVGAPPRPSAPDFRKLPRFGFTGLHAVGDRLFAGSWNGVYVLDRATLRLERIISHPLMSDLHGIWADDETVATVLTCRDTVVVANHDGEIIDELRVLNDLRVTRDPMVHDVDWRFVGKQFRGSTGLWHFNYIQRIDGEWWLTSRNANCFVVVDPQRRTARLRLMNLCTPALIHDGLRVGERFFFTSIDGKVIIAANTPDALHTHQELDCVEQPHLYVRDMVSRLIRLEETALGREPNWCRGVAVDDGLIRVTIDGRYDSDLSFGLLALDEEGRIHRQDRFRWSEVGDERALRYVSGFDIEVIGGAESPA